MSDLVGFLLARYDEEERDARKAGGRNWGSLNRSWDDEPQRDIAALGDGPTVRLFAVPVSYDEHVAHWNPSRVLAECEAKRRILALHPTYIPRAGNGIRFTLAGQTLAPGIPRAVKVWCEGCQVSDESGPFAYEPCLTKRLLALPYADHPDYRQEWRP